MQWVQQAQAALQQRPYPTAAQTDTVWHEILTLRALFLAYAPQPDFAQAIAAGEEVLLHAMPVRTGLHSLAAGAIATVYLKQGDWAQGEIFLAQALQFGQTAREIYVTVASAVNLALAQRTAGSLHKATALCYQMMDWVVAQGKTNHPALGALYTTLADLLCESNELAVAEQYAQQGIVLTEQWARPYSLLISRFILLRVKQAQGQWDAIGRLWQEIASYAEQAHAAPVSFLTAAKAQLLLRQGKLAEVTDWFHATSWLEAIPATILTGQEFIYSYEYNRVVRAQVALALAQATGDQTLLRDLLAHLSRQQQVAEREGLLWLQIKVHCLQALAHAVLDKREAACTVLANALRLAEPEGYLRLFVDEGAALQVLIAECGMRNSKQPTQIQAYAAKVLAAFYQEKTETQAQNTTPPFRIPHSTFRTLVEPLSEREQEVLQLVALGLSNSQIADRLIVTTGTVKTHLNRIFGKLAVQSRTQAIARGRELGLLTD
jgi:LuxR family maltose regulon positive regulatory protein